MKGAKEIEIKTDEVNELLTTIPKWIVRWGITIILSVMVFALFLSFVIKYPDSLSAKATITTLNPPIILVSKTNGKIVKLMASNNQAVKRGEVILVIESAANYKSILLIDSVISNFNELTKLSPSVKDGEGLG